VRRCPPSRERSLQWRKGWKRGPPPPLSSTPRHHDPDYPADHLEQTSWCDVLHTPLHSCARSLPGNHSPNKHTPVLRPHKNIPTQTQPLDTPQVLAHAPPRPTPNRISPDPLATVGWRQSRRRRSCHPRRGRRRPKSCCPCTNGAIDAGRHARNAAVAVAHVVWCGGGAGK